MTQTTTPAAGPAAETAPLVVRTVAVDDPGPLLALLPATDGHGGTA